MKQTNRGIGNRIPAAGGRAGRANSVAAGRTGISRALAGRR
jgi:hypothetical protein